MRARVGICVIAALVLAAPASAARVAVIVQPPFPLERYAAEGAVGLMVPGAGSTVTREGARAALLRGSVRNSELGGRPGGDPLIGLARRPAEITIYVSLPPPGATHNVRRYPVAVVGGGYRGILRSSATRIPGLVSVADVAPTAVALERGDRPRITAAGGTVGDLRALDRRLTAAHDARWSARLVVALVAFVLLGAVLALRSSVAARAMLLAPPLMLAAVLALAAVHEARVAVVVPVLVAAAALGLLARDRHIPWIVGIVLLLECVVLAVAPHVVSLSVLGPHPDGGGRFYGITNEVATLLLAPTLAAGYAAGAIALVLLGASRLGADGGGFLVYFVALALRHVRVRTLRGVAVAAAAAVAVGVAFVLVDRMTGGSSHVVDAVTKPADWLDVARHRWEVAWAGATGTAGAVAMSVAGLVGFAGVVVLRQRSRLVDAMLVAIAVSLVVNDTPQDVLAFGALGCVALASWERLSPRKVVREDD